MSPLPFISKQMNNPPPKTCFNICALGCTLYQSASTRDFIHNSAQRKFAHRAGLSHAQREQIINLIVGGSSALFYVAFSLPKFAARHIAIKSVASVDRRNMREH